MKKLELDADDVYMMANQTLPDNDDLAAFNMLYEVQCGKLISEDTDIEGAELRGLFGVAHLNDHYCVVHTVGDEQYCNDLVELMVRCILELPGLPEDDNSEPEIEDEYPTSVAVMAAWHMTDGTIECVVYRNKSIPALNANSILKDAVVSYEAAKAGASASDDVGGN